MDQPGGVVTIVGPPVIGKTCLAASWTDSPWVRERAAEVFWYQVNDADGEIANFFQLIGEAATKRLPRNPELPSYSAEADLRGFTAAWLKALFQTMPRPPIAFIFDDVHRLLPDAPLVLVLARLARALSDEDRLILISRQEVPAQITDAARRRQRLIRITDLKVNESEYADFQQSTADSRSLTQTAFLAALRHSGHWMAGLPLLPLMGAPARVVHEKLMDLLARLSSPERTALVATAYLQGGLEQDWTLLGGKGAVSVLSKIDTATGLVRRLQNYSIRKHDTIFEQLKIWAEANAPSKDLTKARNATGRLLINKGEVLTGVLLLLAAEAFEATTDAVLNHASYLIDQAKNKELLNIISALPAKDQARPTIQVWAAYARLPFSPGEAMAELAAIRSRFGPELSVSDRALAINGEVYGALSIMILDGPMPLLIDAATELTGQLTVVTEPMRSRLFIGRLIATLLGALTYHDHAAIRNEAEGLLPDLPPESRLILGAALVTHLLLSEGSVEKARAYHRQVADQAQRPDAAHLPVMSWHVGALCLAFRDGDKQAVDKALKELENFGKRRGLEHRFAPAYWVATQAYAAIGDDDAAQKALEKHLALIRAMRELHNHEVHFLRSAVALGHGGFEVAAQEATAGRSMAERYGAVQGQRLNSVVLAMSLAFKGDDSASSVIEEVARVGRDTDNQVFLLHAALASAALAHARRQWEIFELEWGQFARLSLATGIRAVTGINAAAIGQLAHDALIRGIAPKATECIICSWRLLPPASAPAAAGWPYCLEVICLGQGAIGLTTYDDTQHRVLVKARSKTASLLELLAAAASRRLPHQTLIDELWPEAKAQDAGSSLRQQIKRLRELTTPRGVIFQDGNYSLNSRLVMTDVQRLEEAIAAFSDSRNGLPQRIAAFDHALDLYRGPLLPDSTSRLVGERRETIAAELKAKGTAFLKTLARQNGAKATSRRHRLAKLI
jgi:tetratricopeptide (TPR) repeat protein